MKITEHRKRQIKLAKDMMNDPAKSLSGLGESANKAPTKAELRDRIAELERVILSKQLLNFNGGDAKKWHNLYEVAQNQLLLEKQAHKNTMQNELRATLAAYALLATLTAIIVMELVWI